MPEPKIYYQGTEEQFNAWRDWACESERANIPVEGKINKILAKEMPDKQRTMRYDHKIAHQTNPDDYIWTFEEYPKPDMGLTEYTHQEAIDNGYIQEPPEFV